MWDGSSSLRLSGITLQHEARRRGAGVINSVDSTNSQVVLQQHLFSLNLSSAIGQATSPLCSDQKTNKQVPVGTTMRPGSGLMVAEEEEEVVLVVVGVVVPTRLGDVLSIDFW